MGFSRVSGALTNPKPFEVRSTAYDIDQTDDGKTFTNVGASIRTVFTLPSILTPGMSFTFIVGHGTELQENPTNYGVRVVANVTHIIRLGSTNSKAAGYIEATSKGAILKLTAITMDQWYAEYWVGTWSMEVS